MLWTPRQKPIKIEYGKFPRHWGWAYPDEWRIQIDSRMDDRTALSKAPHESLHVLFPWMGEDYVDWGGDHIGSVLWRMGFRRSHEDD